MEHITEIAILIMLSIAFLQSGLDKIFNWKDNISWLEGHFKATFIGKQMTLNLAILTALEIFSGLLSATSIAFILIKNNADLMFYAAISSTITFLSLFFGQRIAKDYAGAQTIVVYLIPTFFLLWMASH